MRKITLDKEKSKSLLRMSRKILDRIEDTDKNKFPSQVLKDYYTSMKQLMEATASVEGVKAEGKGAHSKLIDWVCDNYSFTESDRQFLQQLRKYRNRINYEGFTIGTEYLERNEDKIKEIIQRLRDKLSDDLLHK